MDRKLRNRRIIKRNLVAWSFVGSSFAAALVLVYWPTIKGLLFSVTDMQTYGGDYSFVGLKNYKILLSSGDFLNSLKNTFLLAVYSLLSIPLGFLLANSINELGKCKTQGFFRTMFYLPNIVAGVSMTIIFQQVLKGNGGLLNQFLSFVTGSEVSIGWISDPSISHLGVSIVALWGGLGYSMLMNLANLQAIPREIYDAASVDGATGFNKMRYITIPNMRSCFVFLLITSMITSMSRFQDLFILGGNTSAGRPDRTLQSIMMYIYQYSFEAPNYGISSAGAVILFVIVLLMTVLNLKLTKFMNGED